MKNERWYSQLNEALEQRKSQHLLRVEKSRTNDNFLCFHTNDYLGLSRDPRVIAACQNAAEKYGVGSTGSHLICGHHQEHDLLANELAEFLGFEAVMLFSSGYMANMATITTFLSENDSIFQDKINHASLIDAARYSGARHLRYQHLNSDHLKKCLEKHQQGRTFIVTDGVFSMDGDIADLTELAKIAVDSNAQLMMDDAHGIGVIGENGKGTIEFSKANAVDILIGTFGKAFGLSGAFIASKKIVIDYLKQFARNYIYTTALPIPITVAARKSLEIIRVEPEKRTQLNKNIRQFRDGAAELKIELNSSETPIQNVLINCPEKVMAAYDFLHSKNILVGAIRVPSVPKNTERLRICLNANHTPEQIDYCLQSLAQMQEVIQ